MHGNALCKTNLHFGGFVFVSGFLFVSFYGFHLGLAYHLTKHRDGAKMKQLLIQKGGPFTKTDTGGLSQTIMGGNTSFYAYST